MDRDTYNDKVDRIAEEIPQLSLERHQLYERERRLIRRLVEVRRQREVAARRERIPSPGAQGRALSAAECESRKVDRFGNQLSIGDRVELLTPGRCVGKNWVIYKLTKKRVLCQRNNGVYKTHREYRNVKKL